jgi:hypothetical protein
MIEYNLKLNEDEIRYVLDALNSLRYNDSNARPREYNAIEKIKINIRAQRDDKANETNVKLYKQEDDKSDGKRKPLRF